MVVDIPDIVTYTNFGDHRLRGFWVAGGQISPSPIDFHRRPYYTLALPCEHVITPISAYLHLLQTALTTTTLNGLFSRTTWVSRYQKGKTTPDLNEARGFGMAVASAESYANYLHLAPDRNHTNTPSFNFYRPDPLPDIQPTVSKH